MLEALNNHADPNYLNKTFIALIPKMKNPTSPKDFFPINLCNVIMKMITKTIANMLKRVLSEVVDEEKSVFVKGVFITDNALVAIECFH